MAYPLTFFRSRVHVFEVSDKSCEGHISLENVLFSIQMLGRSVGGGPDLSEVWRLIASLVGVLSCKSRAVFFKKQPFLYIH